jgi:hypothetical protein
MSGSHPYYKVAAISVSVLLVSLLIVGAFDCFMVPATPEQVIFSGSKSGTVGFSRKPLAPSEESAADASPADVDVWRYEFLSNLPTEQPSEPK